MADNLYFLNHLNTSKLILKIFSSRWNYKIAAECKHGWCWYNDIIIVNSKEYLLLFLNSECWWPAPSTGPKWVSYTWGQEDSQSLKHCALYISEGMSTTVIVIEFGIMGEERNTKIFNSFNKVSQYDSSSTYHPPSQLCKHCDRSLLTCLLQDWKCKSKSTVIVCNRIYKSVSKTE